MLAAAGFALPPPARTSTQGFRARQPRHRVDSVRFRSQSRSKNLVSVLLSGNAQRGCLLNAQLGSEQQFSQQNDSTADEQSHAVTTPENSDAPATAKAVTDNGSAILPTNATELKQPGCSTTFMLNVIWQEEFCAVAVDQIVFMKRKTKVKTYRTPMTEYFFWPKVDAWEELKATLEGKDWIPERDTILLLNSLTDIVNYWQEMHTKSEAREKFSGVATFEA